MKYLKFSRSRSWDFSLLIAFSLPALMKHTSSGILSVHLALIREHPRLLLLLVPPRQRMCVVYLKKHLFGRPPSARGPWRSDSSVKRTMRRDEVDERILRGTCWRRIALSLRGGVAVWQEVLVPAGRVCVCLSVCVVSTHRQVRAIQPAGNDPKHAHEDLTPCVSLSHLRFLSKR